MGRIFYRDSLEYEDRDATTTHLTLLTVSSTTKDSNSINYVDEEQYYTFIILFYEPKLNVIIVAHIRICNW